MRSAHHLVTDIVETLEQVHPGLLKDDSLLVVMEAQNEEQAAQSLLRGNRFSGLLILVLGPEVGAKLLADPAFKGAAVDLAKVEMEPGFCRFVMASEGRCRGGRVWRPSAGPLTDLAQAETRVTILVEAAANRLLAQDPDAIGDGTILVINETGAPDLPGDADSLLAPTGDPGDVLAGICCTTIPVPAAIALLIEVELQDLADKIAKEVPSPGSSYALVLIGEHTALTTFERPKRTEEATSSKRVSLEQVDKTPSLFQRWAKEQVEKNVPPIVRHFPDFAQVMGASHVVALVSPGSVLHALIPERGMARLTERPEDHAVSFPLALTELHSLLLRYQRGEQTPAIFSPKEAVDTLRTLARICAERPAGEVVVVVSRGKAMGIMRISWTIGGRDRRASGRVKDPAPTLPATNAPGGKC